MDATGDGVYQLLDLLSLCCALDLLYRMSKTYRETHTEDTSSGSAATTVAWCVLGGSRAGGPGRFQSRCSQHVKIELTDTLSNIRF